MVLTDARCGLLQSPALRVIESRQGAVKHLLRQLESGDPLPVDAIETLGVFEHRSVTILPHIAANCLDCAFDFSTERDVKRDELLELLVEVASRARQVGDLTHSCPPPWQTCRAAAGSRRA